MEFLKKHYEKVILSVVLLGLAGGVVYMLFEIDSEKAYLEEKRKGIIAKMNPYKPVDLSIFAQTAQRAKAQLKVVLSGPHNTFNPVLWQQKLDGTTIKVVSGTEVGVGAATVVGISNLNTTIVLERISTSSSGASYQIGITREAASYPAERRKRSRYLSMTSRVAEGYFTLKEVKGPPENPEALVLELDDTKELINISTGKPYIKIGGYTAEIRYDLENRIFSKVRSGDSIAFAGDEYVVEIKANEVVLSSKSSTKRTTLKLK